MNLTRRQIEKVELVYMVFTNIANMKAACFEDEGERRERKREGQRERERERGRTLNE